MLVIGVDPGLEGAVAAIDDQGRVVSLQDTPTILVKKGARTRHEYVETEMAALIEGVVKSTGGDAVWVAIENVHAMPKQGVSSCFSFGMGFGIWRGILAAMRLRYERINPEVWKRGLKLTGDKGAAVAKALQLFPKAEIGHRYGGRMIYSDGRAEALLIAEYARRMWGKSPMDDEKTLARIFAAEAKARNKPR